ncbi:MAG TPA: response regulator transcription factor, partial [Azospirillaceae bacterium]|nr:response regulator transcription factor [Azospirillaceae bacterium]
DLIRETRQLYPAMEIMVVSVLGDERSVLAAIEAGAAGYILKDSAPVDLVGSVLDLVAGRSPISTSIARTIVRRVQGKPAAPLTAPPPTLPALTERETDILWGIAKGFTYGDIAERLGISRNTVLTHIKNIYRKLEVNSRGEAVFTAINHKIINIGD